MSPAGLLVALAVAAAPAPDATPDEIDTAITVVPQSFADCAAAYARRLKGDQEVEARFDCALRHFQHHPGFDASTYATTTASVHASAVAQLYIDEVLVPALETRLQGENGTDMSRTFLLRGYIRSQRAAGESLCDLYYDWFSGGTIRSIMGGSCALDNSDKLVEALLRFQATIAAH